ncbi:MAG: TIGR03792 family protein [Cyanobacteria bacterium Co-bin8]|nr:TIGR03792 family protein [Cyanobacteria bacterium Co-bin8]
MVIEWLKFCMSPESRERYIELDTEIWTAALSQYPGFVSKEVWIDPDDAGSLIFVIRWATREQWKAIPEADLTQITERFDAAFGLSYEMVESTEFQVRRFPVPG